MSADLEAEILGLLREHNQSLPRTQQVQLGWSSVGSECDREVWSTLTGQPKVNGDVKILAGLRGHAVHAWLAPIFEAAGWETEIPCEYGGIPGSADLYRDGVVADIKTGDASKVRALRNYGPSRDWRWQIHGYGRALSEKGLDVYTVRIIAIAVDTSEEVAVWQEPFDPAVADEALARVSELSLLDVAPEPAMYPDYCVSWCSFYDETGRRGCPSLAPSANTPELTDPRLVEALANFHASKVEEKAAEQAKKAAGAVLDGVYGQSEGLRVKTIVRGDSEELDVQELVKFWELVNGPLPKRRKPGYSYVDVRPVRNG